jgi:hypothetical protein
MLDGSKHLYVLEAGNIVDSPIVIDKYVAGSDTILRSIDLEDVGAPQSFALDDKGSLYVATLTSESLAQPSVGVYRPGARAPSWTMKVPGDKVGAMVSDDANLYVIAGTGKSAYVCVYVLGSKVPLRKITDGIPRSGSTRARRKWRSLCCQCRRAVVDRSLFADEYEAAAHDRDRHPRAVGACLRRIGKTFRRE